MVWLIGVEEGWMGVLHGEGGAAAMAEVAVFWASGEGVAQCFGLERVEGSEGERLGSVERGVSGFGRGEQERGDGGRPAMAWGGGASGAGELGPEEREWRGQFGFGSRMDID